MDRNPNTQKEGKPGLSQGGSDTFSETGLWEFAGFNHRHLGKQGEETNRLGPSVTSVFRVVSGRDVPKWWCLCWKASHSRTALLLKVVIDDGKRGRAEPGGGHCSKSKGQMPRAFAVPQRGVRVGSTELLQR